MTITTTHRPECDRGHSSGNGAPCNTNDAGKLGLRAEEVARFGRMARAVEQRAEMAEAERVTTWRRLNAEADVRESPVAVMTSCWVGHHTFCVSVDFEASDGLTVCGCHCHAPVQS